MRVLFKPYWREWHHLGHPPPHVFRKMYADAYRAFGQLYGPDHDGLEGRSIRAECEALGLPMGYGRIGRAPTLLADEYLPATTYDLLEQRNRDR